MRRTRPRKLNVKPNDIWKQIVADVEKHDVPIKVLDCIVIRLTDGSKVRVDIQELIIAGEDPDDIEHLLNKKLNDMSEMITDVEYYIHLDAVADNVQPKTDNLLRNI